MGLRSEIKRCPVCKEATFADMGTCFNCMHVFGKNDGASEPVAPIPHLEEIRISSEPAVLEPVDADVDEPVEMPASGPMGTTEAEPNARERVQRRVRLASRVAPSCLFDEFLVEFEGFLRDFLLDRKVDL